MISFHPTISFSRYLSLTAKSCVRNEPERSLERLFPHHATTLTDSGRSALALAIEELDLRGKTIAMPAYLCNVLIPVFEVYEITPLFLDIDAKTYQPPNSVYNTELLGKVDAVLLVATYGKPIPEELVASLKRANKIVIEDCAHCSLPSAPEAIIADARCYSLPKIAPVTDGGIAVLKRAPRAHIGSASGAFSLTFIKNWFKLFNVTSSLIFRLKQFRHEHTAQLDPFQGVRAPHKFTRTVLLHELSQKKKHFDVPWRHCIPLRTDDAQKAQQTLGAHGICAERIWNDPIIFHERARALWNVTKNDFPETARAAKEIICAPLWHVTSKDAYEAYRRRLEKILADT